MSLMQWGGQDVDKSDIGDATEWSDEDIARLVGIDEDGNINPVVLAAALEDAAKYPDLYALINAEQIEDGIEPA